jgi:maleylpyruvate isomerase
MIRLHGYWRSSAAYRIRIALNFKGLPYDQVTHDLRHRAHRVSGFRDLSPQGLVPVIEHEGSILGQSLAILEWLEESSPTPPLLPGDPVERAQVRAMASLIACDIHPLNNLRVLEWLRDGFEADEADIRNWVRHWIEEGFGPLERLVERHGGRYAFGDSLTIADCCLVPQLHSATRFGVTLDAYPNLRRAAGNAEDIEAVAKAHPDLQPDHVTLP